MRTTFTETNARSVDRERMVMRETFIEEENTDTEEERDEVIEENNVDGELHKTPQGR